MTFQRKDLVSWHGYVETTNDALILFQACLSGQLPQCQRRLKHKEAVASGDVYIYDECSTNIQRWTDHISWSPSRVHTNFLLYRQVQSCTARGVRKIARKKSEPALVHPSATTLSNLAESSAVNEKDRRYIGSLTDSYDFVENGLLKKTITIVICDTNYHMVSYYTLQDAKSCLGTPRDDPELRHLRPHSAILHQPKWKWLDFDDPGDLPTLASARFRTKRSSTHSSVQEVPFEQQQQQDHAAMLHGYSMGPSVVYDILPLAHEQSQQEYHPSHLSQIVPTDTLGVDFTTSHQSQRLAWANPNNPITHVQGSYLPYHEWAGGY